MAKQLSESSGALGTGGGRGIGRPLVLQLLTRGIPVMAVALRDEELAGLRADCHGPLATHAVDLTREGAVDEVLAASMWRSKCFRGRC